MYTFPEVQQQQCCQNVGQGEGLTITREKTQQNFGGDGIYSIS
jgi:hypothetical protein